MHELCLDCWKNLWEGEEVNLWEFERMFEVVWIKGCLSEFVKILKFVNLNSFKEIKYKFTNLLLL